MKLRLLAASAALGLLATGFAQTPAAASDSRGLRWSACDFDARLECATLPVPLDHNDPRGKRIDLALSRLKATGHSRGILLAVDGGPGGNQGMGRTAPLHYADTPLHGTYDLIGMDLRGNGASAPVQCERTTPTAAFDSRPADSAFPAVLADAKASELACERAGGDQRRYIGTVAAAHDLDQVRAALGERKLNYIGYAYGSYLGAVYQTLYPQRLDRMVLDSVRHPDWTWRQQFMSQAVAIRENVDAWADWAGDRNGALGLGSSQDEVLATVEDTASALASAPAHGTTRTAFDATVGAMANDRTKWADLAHYIHALTPAPPALAPSASPVLRSGILEATTCETSWPTDPEVYRRDMARYEADYPYGLGVTRAQPWACAFRSDPPEAPPQIRSGGHRPGLIVQTENDPQTPLAGGLAMARRLGDRMITIPDDGSNAIYAKRGYRCVDDLVNRYLLTGDLPHATRTTCAGAPRPDVPTD
ncbi:alpha/beta fold hydrolase [Streptomyces sp. NRRL WC-3742]|uniref:alpha/beta fold hydrolase n=1 Tax=Streptomyces sp. NRRL WC-3742 TaxID=1463934 RepID=UPI00068FEB21|nr:alpha/beta fold hydrolase [Streptomyces sp. NRRL WC-3742]